MRSLIVVAGRELHSHRAVLAVAGGALVLALLMPLSPAISSDDAAAAIVGTSLLLGVWVPAVIAVYLGVALLAPELAEGRLGFWLTRPVGAWSLWLGKVGAALLLLVGCQGIVLLPGMSIELLIDDAPHIMIRRLAEWSWMLLLPPLLLLAGHVVAVAVRSRTRWLLLDIFGVVTVGWLVRTALAPLLRLVPIGTVYDVGFRGLWLEAVFLLGGGVAAAVAAGGVQVARGRSDPRRSHRVLSLTVWPALIGLAVVGIALSAWMRSTPPADLRSTSEWAVGPDARWLEVVGAGRLGTPARCLVDTVGGRWRSLPVEAVATRPAFASSAPVAAWVVHLEGTPRLHKVVIADLESLVVRDSGFGVAEGIHDLALSPDGSRLAVLADDRCGVIDLRTRAREVAHWGGGLVLGMFADDPVRIYRGTRQGADRMRVDVLEMTASNDALDTVGSFTAALPLRMLPDPALERIAVSRPGGEWGVVDARTGDLLDPVAGEGIAGARPLADGRLAEVRLAHGEARLDAGDMAVSLGPAEEAVLAGERDGELVVALWRRSAGEHASRWDVVAANLRTGSVREVGNGIFPIPWDLAYGSRIGPVTPGLFTDGEGRFLRWLPDDGRLVSALPG